MPDWRPEDVDNGGTGVLIRYDLNEFELQRAGAVSPPVELAVARPSPARLHAGATSAGEEAAVENQQITQLSVLTALARRDAGSLLPRMEALVRNVVEATDPIDMDAPLMEAGVDSFLLPRVASELGALAGVAQPVPTRLAKCPAPTAPRAGAAAGPVRVAPPPHWRWQ